MKNSQPRWLDIAIRLIIISSTVHFFSFVTADPDLWGHIKFGEDCWKAGEIIRYDPYSFTVYGGPWINHEWLTELIFYGTYYFLGDAGLLFGKLGIGFVIAAVLYSICGMREQNPLVCAAVMAGAIFIISPGFMIRPQLFSFLFFALFMYVLHLYFTQGKNLLFLLPLMMILWVNLHGGFLMGWAMLIAVTGWETIRRGVRGSEFGVRGRRDFPLTSYPGPLTPLWLWVFITSMATLVNPYGYELLVFLYRTVPMPRNISEWKPVILWDLSYLHFKFMALLFLITTGLNLKKMSGWEVTVIGMTLFASIRHQRHTPFFGMMAAPYLVHRLSMLISAVQKRFPKLTLTKVSRHILALFLILLASYQMYEGIQQYAISGCRIIVDPREYPVAAVRFLKDNHIKGNVLIPFAWGEYAIWKLYPDCKISIDGRFETVYSDAVIQDHFIHPDDKKQWESLINKYPTDIILAKQSVFFHNFINESKTWVYVYSDNTAIIFLRDHEKNKEVLERFRTGQIERPKLPLSVYFP